jgi:hypothetical protein
MDQMGISWGYILFQKNGGLMAFNDGLMESNGNFNGIWLVVYLPLCKI